MFFASTVAVVLLLHLYQSTYYHRSMSHSLRRKFKPRIAFVSALCGNERISMNRGRLFNTMTDDKDTEG